MCIPFELFYYLQHNDVSCCPLFDRMVHFSFICVHFMPMASHFGAGDLWRTETRNDSIALWIDSTFHIQSIAHIFPGTLRNNFIYWMEMNGARGAREYECDAAYNALIWHNKIISNSLCAVRRGISTTKTVRIKHKSSISTNWKPLDNKTREK